MLRILHRTHRLGIFLSAAAALSIGALPAQPSAASTGYIAILSVTSAGGDPAMLSIQAVASSNINSITAHLLAGGPGGTDTLDVSDFQLSAGALDNGVWTVQTPITGIPLGKYEVTVDATDTGGDSVAGVDAGGIEYVDQAAVAATDTPTVVSYTSPDVTFSGAVTATPPGGGTPVPLIGAPVFLFNEDTAVQQALGNTDGNGAYSGTVQVGPGSYDVEVAATSTTSAGRSGQINIGSSLTPTKVTAVVTPDDVSYGQSTTISGTASYQDGSAWKPLPGQPVEIDMAPGTGHEWTTNAQTDSSGHFSSSVPTTYGNGWDVVVGSTGGALLAVSSTEGAAHVSVPMTVNAFHAKLLPSGRVLTHGCVTVSVPNYLAPQQGGIQIQYAPHPSGPWRTLGKVKLGQFDSSCLSNGQSYFSGTVGARRANAYYRANFPATVDFQHAVSRAVRSWLHTTSITGFTVSPRSVASGGTVVISGRLLRHGGAWPGSSRRKVEFLYRLKGKKAWSLIMSVRTRANGAFSGRAVASGHGRVVVMAVYLGDARHLWSASRKVTVKITGGAATRSTPALPRLR